MKRRKKAEEPSLRSERCANCKAWDQVPSAGGASDLLGYCRRRPEQIIGIDNDDMPISTHPLMRHDEWCLDFTPTQVH